MRLHTFTILATLPVFLAQPGHAASWHPVESFQGERVEIDKSRIARIGEGKTVAWSRLVLGRTVPLAEGSDQQYSVVEALNRYDCTNRRFATVKRVYLQGEKIVKAETVESPREMTIGSGSVDEKLLTEACKLRTVGEMKQVAEQAGKVAAQTSSATPATEPPAKPMYADMRRVDGATQAQIRTVSDPHAPAPAKSEPAKADSHGKAELPTKIELPSKSDLAAKAAAEQAALLPPAPAAPPTPPAQQTSAPASAHSSPPAAAAPAATRGAHGAPVAPAASTAAHAPPAQSDHAAPPKKIPTYASGSLSKLPRKKAVAEAPPPAHPVHWSYEGEGAPANWSKLQPDYATCSSGKRQSPIDIKEGIRVDLEPIRFNYRMTPIRIVDNGHTIQVNVGPGNTITVAGRQYELAQFHFHRPAEERVNGRSFEMVAHLVHKDYEGNLAVVAALLESGTEHPVIQSVWDNLPLEQKLESSPGISIDMNQFLPDNRSYWTYMGSLTTPPCTEGVTWIVLKQPQQMSSEQIAIFSRFYRHNARPIQPVNSRLIKESR